MNKILMNKIRREKSRNILLILFIITSLLIIFVFFQFVPSMTRAKTTDGKIIFTDFNMRSVYGTINISGDEMPSGSQQNINTIVWSGVPNAVIDYNALDKKGLSLNFRINDNSPSGFVMFDNFGSILPDMIDKDAPGKTITYAEIRSLNVFFKDANVTFGYSESDLENVDENDLTIYIFDENDRIWRELVSSVDPDNNTISAAVDTMAVFALGSKMPGVPAYIFRSDKYRMKPYGYNITLEELQNGSKYAFSGIQVVDSNNKSIKARYRTLNEEEILTKEGRSDIISTSEIQDNGIVELDAIETKNISVKLRVHSTRKGKFTMDDLGRKNPAPVRIPGKPVKYIEIGAEDINFSSAEITIKYSDNEIKGLTEENLAIFHWNGTVWEPLLTTVDTQNNTLSAASTSLSPFGVSETVVYRWIQNTGTAVASGITTNWASCGSEPGTYSISLLTNASTSGCSNDRQDGIARNPAVDLFFNYNYTVNTNVNGNWYYGRLRDAASGGGTFTFKLIYIYSNGTIAALPGSGSKTLTSGQNGFFNISLAGISGTVPAGSKLGLRISKSGSSSDLRVYFGDSVGTGEKSGYFSMTDSVAETYYNLSGYVFNQSSGLPLAGALVQTNTSISNTTDSNGFYTMDLINGTYSITTSLVNYYSNSTTQVISGANINNVNITLAPMPTYHVSGYVFNKTSYEFLSGVNITTNTGLSTTTDETGYYSFDSTNGTIIISAKKSGYGTESITEIVAGEALYGVDFELIPVAKIIVSVNRYVINDDPKSSKKYAQTEANFSLPWSGASSWGLNEWSGNQTTITGYALLLDQDGAPIENTSVSFAFRNWNNSASTILPDTDTDANGIAKVTYDMDGLDYYGNWYVDANVSTITDSTGYIYNWWGCNSGGCRNHASDSPGTATSSKQNSPYTLGRESIISNANHGTARNDSNCVGCHRSYGGTGGGANFAGQPAKTSDVHITDTCTSCHAVNATHGTDEPIKSCGDCHSRTDITKRNTTSGSPYKSNYSGNTAASGHNYNSTIPCIICHGPMHNITKPDESIRFTRNNDTESSHCTTCHASYQKHNNSVNCTLCHSDDVDDIQIFAQNATYITLNKLDPNVNRGNCTNCHQNQTFYTSLKSNSKAGNQSGNNPEFIGSSLEHSDDHLSGGKYNNYWTPLDSYSACKYCHSNPQHSTNALGSPSSFKGTNTVNSTLGSTSWCLSCHYPSYANYSDMVSAYDVVPPSIIKNSTYFLGGRDHSTISYFNDTTCYLCHNGSNTYTTIDEFMHGVYVGGGGPDCLGCHDTGKTQTYLHVNNTAMKQSYHANLNNQSVNSSNVSADNKKCWGCHQSDGSQPTGDSMGDKYTKPYTCDECHLLSAQPYANVSNAHRVTNHIWIESPYTRIVTHNATCSTCHNNKINAAYITDSRNLSKNENVSHYGTLTGIIDSVGDTISSQGCVYCHLNSTNANIWGNAPDIRYSTALTHTQTTNAECYVCHMETTTPVDNLHNSSMYYAGTGKIILGTDKFVILDDPKIAGAKAETTNGYRLPYRDYPTWNFWSGKNTKIAIGAVFYDRYGVPVQGSPVNFSFFMPNGTLYATLNNTTDVNGQANFSYDMNGKNYYGVWKIMASTQISSTQLYSNVTFIYNWWGCSFNSGICNEDHGGKNPASRGTTYANSPYLSGRDPLTGVGDHSGSYNCTFCHQSYDGTQGGTNPITPNDPKHLNNPSDVHRNITCDNASCHGTKTTHDTNQLINSCFTANCHKRTDISGKSTLSNGTVSSALSLYTYNYGADARYHTPNATVPCFVCHGPMHSITKNDVTLRFVKNNETESTHCITCHQDYTKHNRSVDCTVCHSDDVHAVKVLAQNASYVTLDHNNPNPNRGNCTNCHQNSSFFAALLTQPNAGNFSGMSPPQVPVPVEHSNDPTAGQKWNQTPGYWTNSEQVTWCYYCHTNKTHSISILGRPGLFKGNNTVNSTISSSSSWCASCHWSGYTNGSNSYNDMTGTFLTASLAVPPEITGDPVYGANKNNYEYTNHSLYAKDDASCNTCHGYKYGFSGITQLMHNQTRVGGPDCVACHDTGGIAQLAHVNVSAMNDTNALHKNLNSAASVSNGTAYYANNKRCWFCHGDDGTEPASATAHPSRYKTPRRCPDCHIPASIGGGVHNNGLTGCNCHFTIPEDLRSHLWNGTTIRTPAVTTCYDCHNKSEMLIPANDPDNGTGLVYNGSNGGNTSPSHYGKKRNDLVVEGSTDCKYCHQNASTNFASAMLDPAYNTSISNHSVRYNSSNPTCTDSKCHSTGRLHDVNVTKPSITLPHSTLCLSCHGNNGNGGTNYSGAVTVFKEKHNNTINCSECHLNVTKDVHPVKYLLSNASFGTNNSMGLTCISCHQNSTEYPGLSLSPPKIADTMYHSNNVSNGTIWNSTGYWISNNAITSCVYCHNDTKHNATALGRPSRWKGSNAVNSSINSGTWCSSCHYRGYSSGGRTYEDMTSAFISANLSVPPEITNGTYAPYNLSRYYNHTLTSYSDAACWLCHGTNISEDAGISSFMHNITWGTCTSCHYSFEAMNSSTHPERFVDSELYNTSLHGTLNCQNCHTKGHKNMGARKACEDCHAVQSNPLTDKDRHEIIENPRTNMYNGETVVNITDCTTCHNSALYNNSINTYGYGKPRDCNYCHTNPDKYYQ